MAAAAAAAAPGAAAGAPASHDDVEALYQAGEACASSGAGGGAAAEAEYVKILAGAGGSTRAKQLAAQLIPRFFGNFPNLHERAMNAQLDLCEEEEVGIRIQAIRGLPLLCKSTPQQVPKVADVLGQLLLTEDSLELDNVKKALLSVIRTDAKAAITALFNQIITGEEALREKVLKYVQVSVLPMRVELIKPQADMERFFTDHIKKVLVDVTGQEFKLLMDMLNSLAMFGPKASQEAVQELFQIVADQAELSGPLTATDTDTLDRLLSCMEMALPLYPRGASPARFMKHYSDVLLAQLDALPSEPKNYKQEFLRKFAQITPFAVASDARPALAPTHELAKTYMPSKPDPTTPDLTEQALLGCVECLLYAFHQLAGKLGSATNVLCGYKIVTGQPSDHLGEDLSAQNKDWLERLAATQRRAQAATKKLTAQMAEQHRAMTATAKGAAAKDDKVDKEEEKARLQADKAATSKALLKCNNIITLAKGLENPRPQFISGDSKKPKWR
eukprot:jgi/Chlat1/6647/Chrsp49S06144